MSEKTDPVTGSGAFDDGENVAASPRQALTLGDVINARFTRRRVLEGALAAAAIDALAFSRIGRAEAGGGELRTDRSRPLFDFKELSAGSDETHHVAEGYEAQVLIRWGDPVLEGAPPFDAVKPSAGAQALQFGYNNDFLGFLPIEGRADHGLLVVNHEYTNDELMYPGLTAGRSRLEAVRNCPKPLVDASMAAHGGSVLEVKRVDSRWQLVRGSPYARRITAMTPMRFSGPAAGHELLRTSADPSGTLVLGMLNNCAGGVTPWGTWLTCEENFNFYFWNKAAAGASPNGRALKRYGLPEEYYPLGRYYDRFDIGKEPNEANRFGWVVEIDPFDPASVPVKRTAMGRFKHEGAGSIINMDGRFVVYQGDDQRFDYVYKFVSDAKVDLLSRKANADILDRGTLHVARFDADGSGEWLPLIAGHERLGAFKDQGEILIHARLAADALGATRMDRPEDVEVSPRTGKVYVMLTNNKDRGKGSNPGSDAANPRAPNPFGHIVEIVPTGGDHAATSFRWEIMVRCGDPSISAVGATFNPATSRDGWFGMPDNCAFDADGRLWIATDGNAPITTGRADGLWAMATEGAARGTSKLFFRCPAGAELCGPCFTPDGTTLFVSVQHPGESEDPGHPATFENPVTRWPDFRPGMPPRPAVVAITRKGGGKIG